MTVTDDRYLDLDGVYEELKLMGFEFSRRQVRRMFDTRELPVFRWRGKLYIGRLALRQTFSERQREAWSTPITASVR